MTTWYDILQVSPRASKEVIEMAYKALAKKYHPDLQTDENKSNAEENMKLLNQAREILSDSNLRKQYDIFLSFQKQTDHPKTVNSSDKVTEATYKKRKFDSNKNGFDVFISKWPNWLRWMAALPIFVISFYSFYALFYVLYNNTLGYVDTKNFVWTIISQPLSIGLSLYIFFILIPRYKFTSIVILSSIISIILINPLCFSLTNPVLYTPLNFGQFVISDVLTLPIFFYNCVKSFKMEYRQPIDSTQ